MLCSPAAQAKTLCTLITDASSGQVLQHTGDCTTRVTPASTFKLALSLMGFDAGYSFEEFRMASQVHEGHSVTFNDVDE
ncbi:penicillin-binding transpeptidase domain-containing protein [Pseudomonas sp. NPDC007930]|uniref:penicillin-binding transpeptidase domain-containing protein n=1 Tax=Pseudomonas sp. NPDC007930 TaxID=3364417 RepID=UPI0036E11272